MKLFLHQHPRCSRFDVVDPRVGFWTVVGFVVLVIAAAVFN